MSTNRTPDGRLSPAVYRRRRIMVLLVLLAVVVAVVLIIVRPGSSQGESAADPPASTAPADDAADDPPPTTIPTENVAVDGAPCTPEQLLVEAVTDQVEYAADQQPRLSVTITNVGKNACVVNAGTSAQVFTITSGEEPYWTSTDCQTDAVDAEVLLVPNSPISSAVPIIWDRTRSSPDTCGQPREAVPSGGASYHLEVSVAGVQSADSRQFMLF